MAMDLQGKQMSEFDVKWWQLIPAVTFCILLWLLTEEEQERKYNHKPPFDSSDVH